MIAIFPYFLAFGQILLILIFWISILPCFLALQIAYFLLPQFGGGVV